PGLQRNVFACPTGPCLALLRPRRHPFVVPVTAAGLRPMACGIYVSMPVRVSTCGSPCVRGPRERSLPPSFSLAGRDAVTGVLRSARHLRCMAHAVPSFHLIASVRIRISRCTHEAGKARANLRREEKRWRHAIASALVELHL